MYRAENFSSVPPGNIVNSKNNICKAFFSFRVNKNYTGTITVEFKNKVKLSETFVTLEARICNLLPKLLFPHTPPPSLLPSAV